MSDLGNKHCRLSLSLSIYLSICETTISLHCFSKKHYKKILYDYKYGVNWHLIICDNSLTLNTGKLSDIHIYRNRPELRAREKNVNRESIHFSTKRRCFKIVNLLMQLAREFCGEKNEKHPFTLNILSKYITVKIRFRGFSKLEILMLFNQKSILDLIKSFHT